MKFLQTLSSFITALIRKIVNQEYVMDHKVLLEFVQSHGPRNSHALAPPLSRVTTNL